MKNNSFSIIIPVYNQEKYLQETINSVINQTYKNYEVIFVDNGSTDKSIEIINNNIKENNNMKIFFNPERGVSSTRNMGIKKAQKDYIIFLDSDDLLEKNCLEVLNNALDRDDIDIVRFNYNKYFREKKYFPIKLNLEGEVSKKEFNKKVLPIFLESYGLNSVWGQAVKREIIEDLEFDNELIIGEDMEFNIRLFAKAEKISFIKDVLMNYRQNPNSVTKKYDFELAKRKLICIIKVYSMLLNLEKSQKTYKRINREYLLELTCSYANSNMKAKEFFTKINEDSFIKENKIIEINKILYIKFLIRGIYQKYIKNGLKKML